MSAPPLVVTFIGLLFYSGLASGISPGLVDTFSGSLDNWQKGQVNPAFLSVVETGGPSGAGDSYMQSVADGSASFGRLTIFNQNQWSSNYLVDGVTSIGMDLLNSGSVSLQIRLGLRNSGGAGFISTLPFTLGVGGGWQTAEFPIGESDMTAVGSPGSYSSFLSSGFALRILHATGTSNLNGNAVVSTLGVDNITAIPEPTTGLLLLTAVLAFIWWRRFSARRLPGV